MLLLEEGASDGDLQVESDPTGDVTIAFGSNFIQLSWLPCGKTLRYAHCKFSLLLNKIVARSCKCNKFGSSFSRRFI